MLKIKKIAVTGGLAAGKTTVCKIFKELGAYVVSADEIVHQLLSPGTAIGQQIAALLGSDIIKGNTFDRKKIAAKVFSAPHLLTALEELLHPAVFEEIERQYVQISHEKKHALFVAEIPLLYEARAENDFDCIVTVMADRELCRQRFMKETHQSAEEFEKRMKRQMEPEQKADRSHFTIENKNTLEQLKTDVNILYSQLTEE